MKKITLIIGTIIFTGITYSQEIKNIQSRGKVNELITQAKNDLNESDVTARPIKIRKNKKKCDNYYSKIGISDLEKHLIKERNPKGDIENIQKDIYKTHIVVKYDCKKYEVILRKEPIIHQGNSLENKNPRKNPYSLIIRKDNTYKINSKLELRKLTKKYLKEIYGKSIEMSKKYFEK